MSDTLPKDFRAWLSTQPIIAHRVKGRVCEAFVDDVDNIPYIVFQQSGGSSEPDMSGEVGMEVATFDMEVRAGSQAEADAIANEVKRLVNGFPQASLTGQDKTWNGRGISFASVNDHSKEYEILPIGSHETDSIHALIIEVYADA